MGQKPITKILIANRGEIACRIIKTCRRLGIATVAVYSDCDEQSLFVKMADEAYHLGPSVASESYLAGDKIIQVARRSGADAIHPGYGFLSENADFADNVVRAGIIFIGPQSSSMRQIGDKRSSKAFLRQHLPNIPLIPGYDGIDQSVDCLEKQAKQIGFPVLLKASAGGGGKGMRTVYEPERLRDEIESAKGEAERAFKSGVLLIEKYFEHVRHVEVQIFGDQYGHVYHVFERDCTVQRRHQKLVEETPSPAVDEVLRAAMTAAAVDIGRKLQYIGAGTVEFVLDNKTGAFYFLELNTRLQVEHPVTEAITGLDLVELQILVAQGANLEQLGCLTDLQPDGHAIECRLCAEDPDDDFSPRTGVVRAWNPTNTIPETRYDTGIETGSVISVYYDSMMAKIIVHAPTRAEAVRRMAAVLSRTVILGVTTNQKFLGHVMMNPSFVSGVFDTHFITQESQALFSHEIQHSHHPSLLAAFLADWAIRRSQQTVLRGISTHWRNVKWQASSVAFSRGEHKDIIAYEYQDHRANEDNGSSTEQHRFQCAINPPKHDLMVSSKEFSLPLTVVLHDGSLLGKEVVGKGGIQGPSGLVRCTIDGHQQLFYIVEQVHDIYTKTFHVHDFCLGYPVELCKLNPLASHATKSVEEDQLTPYISSMPCRVLRIIAPTGTTVKKNDPLLSIESMKTEVKILSRHDGEVQMHVSENQLVDARVLLCQVTNT